MTDQEYILDIHEGVRKLLERDAELKQMRHALGLAVIICDGYRDTLNLFQQQLEPHTLVAMAIIRAAAGEKP